MYLGDFIDDSTLTYQFSTADDTGTAYTIVGTPTIQVYKSGTATPVTTGITLTKDYNSVTGLHLVTIVTTNAWYEVGKDYTVTINGGTVNGDTIEV